jgi:hypothetical protein
MERHGHGVQCSASTPRTNQNHDDETAHGFIHLAPSLAFSAWSPTHVTPSDC